MTKPLYYLIRVLCLVAVCALASCGNRQTPPGTTAAAMADTLALLRQQGKSLRDASRYGDALRVHLRGLEMARAMGDSSEWIQALNNVGTDYRRMGLLDVAQNYHYQALLLCSENSDTTYQMRKNRVKALNGLGNIYLSIANYALADSMFTQALRGERQLGSATGQAINWANLGAISSARGHDDRAMACYRQSMYYNRQDSNTLGIALCHTYFGHIYERRHEYGRALAEYRLADSLLAQSRDQWHRLEPRLALASVFYHTHQDARALALLAQTGRMARAINSWEHIAETHRLYYQILRRQGRYRDALDHHIVYTAYRDSVLDNEKRDRIHNIGISIERARQQQIVTTAQAELQAEKQGRRQGMVLFLCTVVVLLAVISTLLYVQRVRRRSMLALREATRLREDFFTNVTHEFRTPLTVILGLSDEMAHSPMADAATVRRAAAIQRQGHRLLTLVTQLLDISRVRSVIGEPDWQYGDVCTQVAMVVEAHAEYAAQRGIALACHYEHAIETDFVPEYLHKILDNLLSNALKFTPSGGRVAVDISSDAHTFTLRVSDTGCGMDSSQVAHVFDPFYTTASARATGTGVGMALTHEIVRQWGGHIAVESQPGRGTAFIVVLPVTARLKPAGTAVAGGAPSQLAATLSEPSSGAPIVLVAEDNADVAELIGAKLSAAHYQVVQAADGAAALALARQLVPDLVLTDVMMPRMDGVELCQQLRADRIVCHIPIVMLTARVTSADRIEGIRAGADAYITKPFETEELLAQIAQLLEQRAMLRAKYGSSMVTDSKSAPEIPDPFISTVESLIASMITQEQEVTVAGLADRLHVTTRQLHRKMTALTATSPNAFIRIVRIKQAKAMLAAAPHRALKEVAISCGFTDYSHFAKVFRAVTGTSPTEWVRRQ